MSILLAADIGRRRTGMALADTKAGFVMALDTLKHETESAIASDIASVMKKRNASEIIVGIPLLPQGEEGEQATFVRSIATELETIHQAKVTLLDERYTTPEKKSGDPDAAAACALLNVVLEQRLKAEK